MARLLQIFSNVGLDDANFIAWRRALMDDGWDVRAVSSASLDDYRRARSAWGRLVLRWRMYPGFAWRLVLACWLTRARARIVTTNPFFAPLLAAIAGGGRTPTIMLLYDVYPDALEVGVSGESRGVVHRLMAGVIRSCLRRCDAVVYLGDRIKAHVDARYGPARRAAVIPVATDTSLFPPTPPALEPGAPVRILYCGHLGHMHDTGTVRDLFLRVPARDDVRFVFHASGPGYRALRRDRELETSRWRIDWGDPLPPSTWARALQEGAVALVTLRPGAERVSLPSKTFSAMAAGQAVLAIAPRNSDLADIVLAADCGWVVSPGDVSGLSAAVSEIASRPDALQRKRDHARSAAVRRFDVGVVQQAWRALLDGPPDAA